MPRSKTRLRTKNAPAKPVEADDGSIGARDYVLINLVFAGFCIVQYLIVRSLLSDHPGINFFFGFLVVSFVVVSVFDYIASRLDFEGSEDGSIAKKAG